MFAVFKVLGQIPVDTGLVRKDARLAVGSLPNLLHGPLAADLGVLHSRLGLAVPLDAAALHAPISEAVSAQIHVADAEPPGRCRGCHCDSLLGHGSWILKSHFASWPVA